MMIVCSLCDVRIYNGDTCHVRNNRLQCKKCTDMQDIKVKKKEPPDKYEKLIEINNKQDKKETISKIRGNITGSSNTTEFGCGLWPYT